MGFWRLSPLGFGGLGQRKCASQQRPPRPLARSHHDGITRQNTTRTPTVILWGAAILIKEVRAWSQSGIGQEQLSMTP